jgi:hypothetical protein
MEMMRASFLTWIAAHHETTTSTFLDVLCRDQSVSESHALMNPTDYNDDLPH